MTTSCLHVELKLLNHMRAPFFNVCRLWRRSAGSGQVSATPTSPVAPVVPAAVASSPATAKAEPKEEAEAPMAAAPQNKE